MKKITDFAFMLLMVLAIGAVFWALGYILPTWGLALYLGAILAVGGLLWRSSK